MSRRFLLSAALLASVASSGCGEEPTAAAPPEMDRADAALLAERIEDIALAAVGGWPGPHFAPARAGRVPLDETFSRTLPCPKGGQVTLAGTRTGEADRATRTLVTQTRMTKTPSACAVETRAGVVVTVTGDPSIALQVHRKVVGGVPSGPQTTTQKGAFRFTRSDGKSGSCEVDLTTTLDPDARTLTRKGTLCGRTVDVSRSVPRG